MSEEQPRSAEIESEARALLGRVRTLVLATVTADGEPHASYAPFVEEAGALHVYVSALSPHTANLLGRRRASVLLVEDEAASPQPFARTRLSLECAVEPLDAGSGPGSRILDAFEARFGNVMELIRPLPDFRLLRLAPERGTFVRGFGQAYAFEGPALAGFRHLDEAAVRARSAPGA